MRAMFPYDRELRGCVRSKSASRAGGHKWEVEPGRIQCDLWFWASPPWCFSQRQPPWPPVNETGKTVKRTIRTAQLRAAHASSKRGVKPRKIAPAPTIIDATYTAT